jgi:hypothetical protein
MFGLSSNRPMRQNDTWEVVWPLDDIANGLLGPNLPDLVVPLPDNLPDGPRKTPEQRTAATASLGLGLLGPNLADDPWQN